MKRVNVNYYFTIEFGDLFRPSMKDSIRDALYEQNVRTIKDVCQLEEKQFRRFPFATDDVVNRVKKRMADYGLRFGMTLDELTAYQDADFPLCFILRRIRKNRTKRKKYLARSLTSTSSSIPLKREWTIARTRQKI